MAALQRALSQSAVLSKREQMKPSRNYGIYRYACGSWYKGEWNRYSRQGKGYFNLCTGDVYEGNFDKGNRSGSGTLKSANGGIYKGEWRNDMREGFGTQQWDDDSVYHGTWKAGKQNIGTYVWPNGDEYSGSWKGWQMEGEGALKVAHTGQVLKGTFKSSKLHGQNCERILSNGSWSKGEWMDGLMRGKGSLCLITENGSQEYEGDFMNNREHGEGHKRWHLQSPYVKEYEGRFQNGKPHGQGTFYYSNGAKYTGQVSEGLREGKGTLTMATGKEGGLIQYEGEWVKNKKEGQGRAIVQLEGVYWQYVGKFSHDQFHGHGVLKTQTYEYIGSFMEGKKQGKGKVKTKDGKEMEGLFEESKSKGVEGVPLFETIKVSEYFNI